MNAHIRVMLKSTVLDPQGQAIQHALASQGYSGAKDVRQGKYFLVRFDGLTREQAREQAERLAREILTNPVIEDFTCEISE
jgi:phosphoribosylformylglycinamidine synthase PurS subunit